MPRLIFKNDIKDDVSSKILKFADDTKSYRVVNNQADIEVLQSDLVKICNCSKDWLILFNIDKCKKITFWRRKSKRVIQHGRKAT